MPDIWIEPTAYETPFGNFCASWSALGLYSFRFVSHPLDEVATQSPPFRHCEIQHCEIQHGAKDLRRGIDGYVESGQFEFPLHHFDFSGIREFSQRVLRKSLLIPSGRTWTYGKLATAAGSPSGGRAVGMVMANNRWPLIIPCHRVVGSSGNLTGYSGAGGLATKQQMLDFERSKIQPALF